MLLNQEELLKRYFQTIGKSINNDNKTLIGFWNLNEKGFISRILRKSYSDEDLLNAGLKNTLNS